MKGESCKITHKDSSCCSSRVDKAEIDLKDHWNNTYSNNLPEKLGWYETDLTPTLNLVFKTEIKKKDRILNVGAGSTTLIDALIDRGYSNLIATDISNVSLQKLTKRLGKTKIETIVDDLVNPVHLNKIPKVNLWIDRAVLHFFTKNSDQKAYFDLLKSTVANNGYVILAEYNLEGAKKCAGLPINRYSKEILVEKMGSDFDLIESFEHIYTMPIGDKRPYIYTLFKKV